MVSIDLNEFNRSKITAILKYESILAEQALKGVLKEECQYSRLITSIFILPEKADTKKEKFFKA